MTFDKLGPLLLPEEAQENLYNQANEKALTMKDKGKGKSKNSQSESKDAYKERKKKIKCCYCEKMGHTVKECKEEKADLKWTT